MIAPRLLSQAECAAKLKAAGLKDTGEKIEVQGQNYGTWITDWGELLMVPELGPDHVCGEWALNERLAAVLATKPKPALRRTR